MEALDAIPASPHVPVLADAVRRLAAVRAGEIWVDCTLGFGGHTRGLLEAGACVYGVDRDADARRLAAARLAACGEHLQIVPGDFRDLPDLLAGLGVGPVDGLLADLGVSSWQLDRPERGFSFREAGPVDMRMDPSAGRTAEALIRETSVGALAEVIKRYGEEPFALPVARAIRAWAEGPGPHDTLTLAEAVRRGLPAKVARTRKRHPATRTFQALRIAVNDELGALEALLEAIPTLLRPGGRALIISFHSLEDRLVKQTFRRWSQPTPAPRRGLPSPDTAPPPFIALTRKPAVASVGEEAANPRARSARLRAVQRRPA